MAQKTLTPLATTPVAVGKVGGSMKVTIPPAFFAVSGIDKDRPLEGEAFYDGENLVMKIRPVAQPAQP